MVKIFIGNIPDGARSNELKTMFEKYGLVSECAILTNFGFVHMDSEDEAYSAVKGLDGAFFAGTTIKVEISHGKPSDRGGRGGGFRGGGFRGGDRGGRGRGGGGFRDREKDRYDDYSHMRERERDYYSRPDLYARDPYARDPYGRDPYARDPYARDPYARDPYARDPYARDPYARDPYERRPLPRDPYERRPSSRDIYGSYSTTSRDAYGSSRDAYASSRDAYPSSRDPYTSSRDAYPSSRDPYGSSRDPYAYSRDPYRDRSPVSGRREDYPRRSYEGYDTGGRAGSPDSSRRH